MRPDLQVAWSIGSRISGFLAVSFGCPVGFLKIYNREEKASIRALQEGTSGNALLREFQSNSTNPYLFCLSSLDCRTSHGKPRRLTVL